MSVIQQEISGYQLKQWGETKDACGATQDISTERRCAVKWGNDLGPDDVLELGLYIPYNSTVIAHGFSMDDDRCTSGSFDIELWGVRCEQY